MSGLAIVVAIDAAGGIGRDGTLPWRLAADMAYFRRLTTATRQEGRRNAVIMGRRTWESLPARFRPLPGRINAVLSRRTLALPREVVGASSLDEAVAALNRDPAPPEQIFVIGGASVYREALARTDCTRVYLTRIDAVFPCDVFFPALPASFICAALLAEGQEGALSYRIELWQRAGAELP
jgi:dihydrofolate reductase